MLLKDSYTNKCRKNYPEGVTAIDVYVAVSEIFKEYCQYGSITANKRISISESVAKMMQHSLQELVVVFAMNFGER